MCLISGFVTGEGKYPVYRVFLNNTYLCHAKRHVHTVDWVRNVLNIVKWGQCHAPDEPPPPANDSPAVTSNDYLTYHAGDTPIDPKKYMAARRARDSRQGDDLETVPDEL